MLDLGFAIKVDPVRRTFSNISGTPAYMAPEVCAVLLGTKGAPTQFGFAVDLWAAGISLFLLLGGYPPFEGDTMEEVFNKITTADVRFDGRVWRAVSAEAKV